MKRTILLVPFIAVATLMFVSLVAAGEVAQANTVLTQFNGVYLLYGNTPMTAGVGDTVPVRVTFQALNDTSDVRIRVSMEGHREEISASTERFDVIGGSIYTKLLTLELPSDVKDLSEEYTLYVEIVTSSDKTEKTYEIQMQRESYTLEILSVDYSSKVSAGDMLPVSVVAKNNGFNKADDNYVVVSIPELGVSTRGYLGDLVPIEGSEDEDEEDALEELVYLRIPEDAESGVYELEVKVYNEDSETIVRKLVSVEDSKSLTVLAASKNKDLNAGETVTYELVIVNSADSIKVYDIRTISGNGLDVSAPSVITVGPDSSETVSIVVKASDDADIGAYTFSVDVDGEQVNFGANVVGKSTSTSIVALTVVLAIIFLVLLAVLIVLLTTRKERPTEEVETSYY